MDAIAIANSLKEVHDHANGRIELRTIEVQAPVVSTRRVKFDQRRQSRRAWALIRLNEEEMKKTYETITKDKKGGSTEPFRARIETKLKEAVILKGRVGNFTARTFDNQDSPPQGKRK